MDTRNLLITKKLVGNDKNDAVIEFALQGPKLKVKQNNIRQKFKSIRQSFKDNLKEVLTNIIVNIIAGIPDSAHMIKNSPKPYESTMKPDELEINLEGKVPNKNKPAY